MKNRTWVLGTAYQLLVSVLAKKKKSPLIRRKGFIKPYRNFTKLLGELNKQLVGRALGTSHKNTQS